MALAITACNGDDDPDPTPVPPTQEATATAPAATPTFEPAPLEWAGCGGDFECATLAVPLDHDDPAGETIDLALARRPADDQEQRIGVLLVNPGGPGASGVDLARAVPAFWPDALTDRFDIIGFDPRGVGESTPIDCGDGADFDAFFALDPAPDTPQERDALIDGARDYAGRCEELSANLLPHVGTADAARDMDLIRRALGEEKISYVGYSYGTLLGATYADLFPVRVRAFVLDGALDVTLDGEELSLQQAAGFERALTAFLTECASRPGCAFGDGDPFTAFDDLLARVETAPLETSGERRAGPAETIIGALSALYDQSLGWPLLERALGRAEDENDGAALLLLFDALAGRNADGTYSNLQEANTAVNCIDGGERAEIADYDALVPRLVQAAPSIGATWAYLGLTCAFWPVEGADDIGPLDAPGSAPILVIGTTGDPATPYAWSEAMAAALDSGVLLTLEGEGHTAFGSKSDCIDDAVVAYLVELMVPAAGVVCG